eukprot:GHVS01062414.1.p1 GENE.GHVS01062414.1~~GHVS01062414.1.p1  ORF type:complete len:303 (+),score=31.14 GHVS01062414.1:118-1026(+)
MKTFRITILAIGVAIAIGTTWVEARDLKVWCHENKQCAYGGKCVRSADMQNVVAELTGQSERKRSVVISEELAGVCAEVFDLWVSDSSMQKFEQYSNEHNDDERKRLQAELADDVPVVFCSGNNECKGEGNVCEMCFLHNRKWWTFLNGGICKKVLPDECIYYPLPPTEDQEATNISKSVKMVRSISTELSEAFLRYDVYVTSFGASMHQIEGSFHETYDWHECMARISKRADSESSAAVMDTFTSDVLSARATVIQVLRSEKVQAVQAAALKSTRQKETATLSNVAEELKNNTIFIRNEYW